jgi:SAM-dependent methyltransferase
MIQSEKEKTKGFEGRIRRLNALLPYRGDLIDIGCGTGHFLTLARKAGFAVKGIEPHREAAEHCRQKYGLDVFLGTMEDCRFKPESFDAVTLWDVWEHVYDPIAFMDRCLELLSPGGILALAIPNASGWPARLFKGNWRYVMFSHLSYFKLDFVHRTMNQRQMRCIHTDHTVKIHSLLQGLLSFLPIDIDVEELVRMGRKDGIETDSVRATRPHPDAKDRHALHLARQLALSINLIRFAFPVGDMVDMYFRKE